MLVEYRYFFVVMQCLNHVVVLCSLCTRRPILFCYIFFAPTTLEIAMSKDNILQVQQPILPVEILIKIFKLVVDRDGPVPRLCR